MSTIIISEFELSIDQNGQLVIPADVIKQMGLIPEDHICVSYIADGDLHNIYREFLISEHPLGEQEQEKYISVPTALLQDANIPNDANVQIICTDGAVIICREKALQTDELSELLQSLSIATDLIEDLPQDIDESCEALRQYIDDIREVEGEWEYE